MATLQNEPWIRSYANRHDVMEDDNIDETLRKISNGQIGSIYTSSIISADNIESAVKELFTKYGVVMTKTPDISIGYLNEEKNKTFTLDEIITIIESMDTRLNVNVHGIWENTQEHLIDKDKLIEKIKSC
jgi:hypothetical protein